MDRLVGSEVLESKVVALYKLPHIPARALESQVVVAYFLVAIRVSV
jgi:hypothetical protein